MPFTRTSRSSVKNPAALAAHEKATEVLSVAFYNSCRHMALPAKAAGNDYFALANLAFFPKLAGLNFGDFADVFGLDLNFLIPQRLNLRARERVERPVGLVLDSQWRSVAQIVALIFHPDSSNSQT
jgi:hypothetical protein